MEHHVYITVAKEGARQALAELGLDDDRAREDIREMREWINSYRAVKGNVLSTTANIFTTAFWATVLGGIVWYLKDKLP